MDLPDKPVAPVSPDVNSFGITEDRYLKIKDETNKIYSFNVESLFNYLILLVIVLSYFYGNFYTFLLGIISVSIILIFLEKLYTKGRLAKIEDLPNFENYKRALDIFSSQKREYEDALKKQWRNFVFHLNKQGSKKIKTKSGVGACQVLPSQGRNLKRQLVILWIGVKNLRN